MVLVPPFQGMRVFGGDPLAGCIYLGPHQRSNIDRKGPKMALLWRLDTRVDG